MMAYTNASLSDGNPIEVLFEEIVLQGSPH